MLFLLSYPDISENAMLFHDVLKDTGAPTLRTMAALRPCGGLHDVERPSGEEPDRFGSERGA